MRCRNAGTLSGCGLALIIGSSVVDAQQLVPRPFTPPGVQAFHLDSPGMGERYELVVSLPANYAQDSSRAWPLVLVTDGYWAFQPVSVAAASLASQGVLDGVIVASLGVPAEAGDPLWGRRRIYEFSPPEWAMTDPFGQVVRQACATLGSAPGKCTGGAPAFLRFITGEVLPLLARQYRVDATSLGLFGASAGGYFASWVLFQPDSPFSRYLVSSPALAYGDGEIFRQERRFAESHKDLPVRVYMASGGLEMEDPFLEGVGQIVSGQARLSAALRTRNYPGLRLVTEIHPGLGHADVIGTTAARGLRVLYGNP